MTYPDRQIIQHKTIDLPTTRYQGTHAFSDEILQDPRFEQMRDWQRALTIEKIQVRIATDDPTKLERRVVRTVDCPSRWELLRRVFLPRRMWRRYPKPYTHTTFTEWRPLFPDVPVPPDRRRVVWHQLAPQADPYAPQIS